MKDVLDTARGRRSKTKNIIHFSWKLTGKKEGILTELWRVCTEKAWHVLHGEYFAVGIPKYLQNLCITYEARTNW